MRTRSRTALLPALVGLLLVSTLDLRPALEFEERLPAGFARTRERDPDRMSFRDLQRLPAIGPARARAIVEARHAHGLRGGPKSWGAIAGIGDETVRGVIEALAIRGSSPRDP